MNIGSLFHTPIESQIPQWVKELKVKSPYMKKIRVDDCICHGKIVDHNRIKDRILTETNIKKVNIKTTSYNSFRVYLGPFNDLNSLKNEFNSIKELNFENLEIIKQ